jgi:hypothetical protein
MFTKQDQQILSERYKVVQELNISPAAGMSTLGSPIVMAIRPPSDTDQIHNHDHDEGEEHDESEIEMACADLYKLAEYSPKLMEMIKQMPSLEGWVAAKITTAADYIDSVYGWLKYSNSEDCGCEDGHEDSHNHSDTKGMFSTGYEDEQL